jgi:hypothetical protein
MDALTQEAVAKAERYLAAYAEYDKARVQTNTKVLDAAVSQLLYMENAYTQHLARAVLSMAKQLEGSTK